MNYRIAVCDDDPVFLEETTNLILNYQFEKDMNLTLSPFKSSKNLLTNFRHANDYHIVFLDIEMPEPNGIELASIIRSSIEPPCIYCFCEQLFLNICMTVSRYTLITICKNP